MILGSFSFCPQAKTPNVLTTMLELIASEAYFHQEGYEGFNGGYLLHPKLNSEPADFYFCDKFNDIIVLMSGYIYNKSELLNIRDTLSNLPSPALVAELFRCEGPDFIEKLNGDFAIFISQPGKKRLICSVIM